MDGRTKGAIAHLAGIGVLTLLLLWPALWSGAPTAFSDTFGYYKSGGEAVEFVLDRAGLGAIADGNASDRASDIPPAGAEDAKPVKTIRSLPYSVFVNLSVRIAGPMAAVVPAALVTAWLIWLMMAPLPAAVRLGAGAVTAAATTLPFYASQIMPDIEAAWLIAIPIVVMRRGAALGGGLAVVLSLAATAAILFHYSHIPLAAATGGVLGLWFLWRRRYGAALLAQGPLLLAVAVNLGLSLAMAVDDAAPRPPADRPAGAEEEAVPRLSIAPARLPVLLARLLEDGVALPYLSQTCPENGFAICEVHERLPGDSHEALWGENNLSNIATPGQMRRISAEEMALARQVILYDPLGQFRASAGNTAEQLMRFGLGGMRFADYEVTGPKRMAVDLQRIPFGLFSTLERVQAVSVPLAALALLAFAWRVPTARAPVALLAVGLLANAFVCGALSAPAGRYQGRMIWLVLTTALAFAPCAWWRHPCPIAVR